MSDTTVHVKGSPVRSLQKFIDAELTAEQKATALGALPPDHAERLRAPILATEKVDVHMLNLYTEEAARAKGEPLDQFARRAGRAAANEAIRGMYRFFALVLTPPALLSKASHMWSTLYDRGQMLVDRPSETTARIRLASFPAEAAGCARLTGWLEGMAEVTGAANVRVEQIECFAKGDPACVWDVSWE